MLLGAEPSELGADDLEELADGEDEYFRLGDVDEQFRDYAALALKGDHGNRSARSVLTNKDIVRVWLHLCSAGTGGHCGQQRHAWQARC